MSRKRKRSTWATSYHQSKSLRFLSKPNYRNDSGKWEVGSPIKFFKMKNKISQRQFGNLRTSPPGSSNKVANQLSGGNRHSHPLGLVLQLVDHGGVRRKYPLKRPLGLGCERGSDAPGNYHLECHYKLRTAWTHWNSQVFTKNAQWAECFSGKFWNFWSS